MKEELLQIIWKYLLFNTKSLNTASGQMLRIINNGNLNTDSGPDFENALIEIEGTKWAGSVEIHVNASDWVKHKHKADKAYDKVILHVVYNYNTPIYNSHNVEIPCLELKGRIPLKIIKRYKNLSFAKSEIACRNLLYEVPAFDWIMWKDRLTIERLSYKAMDIEQRLKANNFDWDDCFYQLLSRSMGLKVNTHAFQQLNQKIPKPILNKHIDDLKAIEAMLFGVAGFLNEEKEDNYFKNLQKEFEHYKYKFNLKELPKHIWKFMRLRPASFPSIRIAQLAALLHKNVDFFGTICNENSLAKARQLLNVCASSYWDEHYVFGKKSDTKKPKKLGRATIDVIIINAVCPLLFVFGKTYKNQALVEKAINWLAEIKAEKNNIISKWNELGIETTNASESQALIHLYNKYCSPKKCLHCQIGLKLLRH